MRISVLAIIIRSPRAFTRTCRFFTTDLNFTRDAARLFNYMTGYAEPDRMDVLHFSPLTTRNVLLERINQEIDLARAGKPASIWLKLNGLVD
jgi:polyphosphate kinase